MPLLLVKTSAPAPEAPLLLQRALCRELAAQLGTPERYVMTVLECNAAMTFGADDAPCCYVEVKSIGGLDGDRPRRISACLCPLLGRHLGLTSDRIYLEFKDVPAHLWGWNGGSFG